MRKKKRLRKSQEGRCSVDHVAWEVLKGLGKASYQAARMGAGKAIQSDLAQKKAMELMSPLVGPGQAGRQGRWARRWPSAARGAERRTDTGFSPAIGHWQSHLSVGH